MTKRNQNMALVAAGVVVLILAFWIFKFVSGPKPIVADFINSSGESVMVSFDNKAGTATVDGAGLQKKVLARAVSASGARYTDDKEGLELWNKGNEITLSKEGLVVFQGKTFTLGDSAEAENDLYVFAGPTWVWQETRMNDDSVVYPKKPGEFSLTFDSAKGQVFAKTDCNNFSGSYTAGSVNVLTFGPFLSTLKYCEGSQEPEFSKMVSEANQYTFTPEGDLVLMLKFDSGVIIFKKQ